MGAEKKNLMASEMVAWLGSDRANTVNVDTGAAEFSAFSYKKKKKK